MSLYENRFADHLPLQNNQECVMKDISMAVAKEKENTNNLNFNHYLSHICASQISLKLVYAACNH